MTNEKTNYVKYKEEKNNGLYEIIIFGGSVFSNYDAMYQISYTNNKSKRNITMKGTVNFYLDEKTKIFYGDLSLKSKVNNYNMKYRKIGIRSSFTRFENNELLTYPYFIIKNKLSNKKKRKIEKNNFKLKE